MSTKINQTTLAQLADVDLVVAVGSVDGVLTTAALLRAIVADEKVEIVFTQAFTVDKLPVASWAGRHTVFIDLAVNNRSPEMTCTFVQAFMDGGNKLVAVIDEHNREDWRVVLGNFDGLVIEPQSQNAGDDAPKSSGELFRCALAAAEVDVDRHTLELLVAADAGDRMDFSSHFGGLVNKSVKSAIADDSRRVYLARHFAKNHQPDETIAGWMREYEEILKNHEEILKAAIDLGDGFVRVTTTGRKVDVTTLMAQLYKQGRIVVVQGVAFVPSEKRAFELVSLGTGDKALDLLAIVRAAGVNALGGFAQKANVALADEKVAIAAIRKALAR